MVEFVVPMMTSVLKLFLLSVVAPLVVAGGPGAIFLED